MLDLAPADSHVELVRIEAPHDLPPLDERTLDVAVLDMHHGYANVGHAAIVALVREAAAVVQADLARGSRRVRVLSYAVRDRLMVPDHASGRHRLYLGTGGPGHLDPRRNTENYGTEKIREDPSWEAPLFALFDAIAADQEAALFGVCHTFGLLCRWSGVAEPVLRGPGKGGAKSGVGTNVLTPEALAHPWFASLAGPRGQRGVPVLDSRYYDLIPRSRVFPVGTAAIAFESAQRDEEPGEALTMLEIAREQGGDAPRVFAVNSHPEIGTFERVRDILDDMLVRGALSPEAHQQRSMLLPTLASVRPGDRLRVGRRVFGDLVTRRLGRMAQAA